MSSETSNFVTHTFGGCGCDLIDYAFVGVEVESEAGVVFLDDGASTLFYGFSTNSILL